MFSNFQHAISLFVSALSSQGVKVTQSDIMKLSNSLQFARSRWRVETVRYGSIGQTLDCRNKSIELACVRRSLKSTEEAFRPIADACCIWWMTNWTIWTSRLMISTRDWARSTRQTNSCDSCKRAPSSHCALGLIHSGIEPMSLGLAANKSPSELNNCFTESKKKWAEKFNQKTVLRDAEF